MNLLARLHLHPEVIDGAALTGVLQKHQLQWRLRDGEVGVAGFHLGRGRSEQLAVEGDGGVQVIDIEG